MRSIFRTAVRKWAFAASPLSRRDSGRRICSTERAIHTNRFPNSLRPSKNKNQGRNSARPPESHEPYSEYKLTTRCSFGRSCMGNVPKMRRINRLRSRINRSKHFAAEPLGDFLIPLLRRSPKNAAR